MKQTYIFRDDRIKQNAIEFIRRLPFKPMWEMTAREVKSLRSLEQNDKMWAMLTDISRQVVWYGKKLPKETWKDMVTAALKGQETVPGIESGFVVIGAKTSKMSIKEMIDVIEFCYAFGADPDHVVKWSEPK